MNITLHRTLMVCMLAGALALTIALVAAKDVSAAPSPALAGGATQISGDARFDDAEAPVCDPVMGYEYALVMTGDFKGCLYTHVETGVSSPSGTYRETGTELFVGSYLNRPGTGTFTTTYRFEAKYDLSGEIFGRCQHPIVKGTGVFEGVSGELFFKDEVATGKYFYRGHLRY